MTFEREAAAVVVAGFDGKSLPRATARLIDLGLAGAILFKWNVGSPEEVAALCRELKEQAGARPFLNCADQEGGRVARLRDGFTPLPPMRRIGEIGEASLAQSAGSLLARELRAVGFDLDLAPVVDVDSNPANPVIGDRSFSNSPQVCARLGAALVRGIQDSGVAACAKHFPGHGDTLQDSHLTLPRLPHDLERLRRVEWPPFAAAIQAGVASIMTAHVIFEALDPDLPATLSARALAPLRGELAFNGVIISDDLEMAAIARGWPVDLAAPMALKAGCDLLLVCHHVEQQQLAVEALARSAEQSIEFRDRLLDAAGRVRRLAETWAKPAAEFQVGRLRRPDDLDLARRLGSPSGSHPDPTAQGRAS
jgi:beta-N-acetylhexosaminidase